MLEPNINKTMDIHTLIARTLFPNEEDAKSYLEQGLAVLD